MACNYGILSINDGLLYGKRIFFWFSDLFSSPSTLALETPSGEVNIGGSGRPFGPLASKHFRPVQFIYRLVHAERQPSDPCTQSTLQTHSKQPTLCSDTLPAQWGSVCTAGSVLLGYLAFLAAARQQKKRPEKRSLIWAAFREPVLIRGCREPT